MHVLVELRPELTDGVARTLVHAAIGAVQSVATYDGGLPRDEVVTLLVQTSFDSLGVEPPEMGSSHSRPSADSWGFDNPVNTGSPS